MIPDPLLSLFGQALGIGGFSGLVSTPQSLTTNSANSLTWATSPVIQQLPPAFLAGAAPKYQCPPVQPSPDLTDPIVWLTHRVNEICWKP